MAHEAHVRYLQQTIALLLKCPITHIEVRRPLTDLGIESLTAVRLQSKITRDFGVTLSIVEFLGATTLEHLAEILALQQNSTLDKKTREYEPALLSNEDQRFTAFPLTDIQQSYWVGRSADLVLGGNATHFYQEYERDVLDIARLEDAWNRLILHHDMLRAIVQRDGLQRVLTEVAPYFFTVYDLRKSKPDTIQQTLAQVRQELDHQNKPTDQWPLFEIRIGLLPEERMRIHLSFDVLILDFSSFFLLMKQWHELYRNANSILPEIPIYFRDYVHYQQEALSTNTFQKAEHYWKQRLAALPAGPELPLVRQPSQFTTRPMFTRLQHELDRECWIRLKAHGARRGVTPSAILLAAYARILQQWSKQAHFCVNVTLFNRPPVHPQIDEIVGDFTSVNPLEIHPLGMDTTFDTLVQQVNRQLWQDLEHSAFSGVQVQRELTRLHGDAFNATMPIVFTSGLGSPHLTSDGRFSLEWLGEQIYAISQTPQVLLDYQVYERNETLCISWDAVAEIFPEKMLSRMFTAYCFLLTHLADDEACWQEDIALLPEEDRLLQMQANQTEGPLPTSLLHTPFYQQAGQRHDTIAVLSSSGNYTYRHLVNLSNFIASWLIEHGAQREQLVAVLVPHGREHVAAVLGIVRSGAAYLPIDVQWPWQRIAFLLEQAGVSLVLTTEEQEQRFPWPISLRRLCLDQLSPECSLPDVSSPEQHITDLAYVIYTSGSTGTPKGVAIEHLGAMNTIEAITAQFAVEDHDRVLALSALSFDLSVYDIFGLLAVGGALVFPEAQHQRDPAHWLELIAQHQVTLWNSAPALLEMLLEYAESNPVQAHEQLANLRLVLLSGDWIPVTLPERLRRLAPHVQPISLGGATEASIWSICYPIEQVDPTWTSIPYGRPLRNQRFFVLNETLSPCPVHVPGRLYIGGVGLTQGYWGDEERTRERFVLHPQSGERLYWTGDLGRWRADGTIEFLGREDNQVKIRGHRIELGEVEAALRRQPGVQDSIASVLNCDDGQRRLVAYVITHTMHLVTEAQLKQALTDCLPAYMVPTRIVVLERFPLTPNGKVDRKQLPNPFQAQEEQVQKQATVLIATGKTGEILDVIARTVKLPTFDASLNLLQLGINSLQLVQLANALEQQMGWRPPLLELVSAQSIYELAHTYASTLPEGLSSVSTTSDPGWSDELERLRALHRPTTGDLSSFSRHVSGAIGLSISLDKEQSKQRIQEEFYDQSSHQAFLQWLRCLLGGELKEASDAESLYTSFLHLYLFIPERSATGIMCGAYYLDAQQRMLIPVEPGPLLKFDEWRFADRLAFSNSAFSLYFVVNPRQIAYVFGGRSLVQSYIDVGRYCERVRENTVTAAAWRYYEPEQLDIAAIKGFFHLDHDDVVLHALFIGKPIADTIPQREQNGAIMKNRTEEWEEGVL